MSPRTAPLRWFPLPLALLAALAGACTDDPAPTLADELASVRTRHGLPALAAAIASPDDGVLDIAAVGVRRAGQPTPVTSDDQWHLGSCTKAMTATLVAMAVDEGRLRWDTTLAEALPAVAPHMDPAYRDVPLTWLLAHRAGTWTDFAPHEGELAGLPWDQPVAAQRAAFADLVLREPPELTPGTTTAYSNAGYVIAGAILEATYGMPWEDVITARLFAPLGMTSCGFGPPGVAAPDTQPWGHDETLAPVSPLAADADNPPALGPAGTVHCSLPDWSKFLTLQLGASPPLVSPASLAVLHTAVGEMALGWVPATDASVGPILLHDGSNTRWLVVAGLAPDADRAVMMATNAATPAAFAALTEELPVLFARAAP